VVDDVKLVERVTDLESEPDFDGDCVGDGDNEIDPLPVGETLMDGESDTETEGVSDNETVREDVVDMVIELEGDVEIEGDACCELEGVNETDGVTDAVGDKLVDAVTDMLGEMERDEDDDCERDEVSDRDDDADSDCDDDKDTECVRVDVILTVGDADVTRTLEITGISGTEGTHGTGPHISVDTNPFPNWPYSLYPKHFTSPFSNRTQEKYVPTDTEYTPVSVSSGGGVGRKPRDVSPFPN
jgi:hypothetical protein